MITAATLVFAAFEPSGRAIWWIVLGGAVINILYLLSVAVVTTAQQQPRWFFYLLAGAAFVGWAIAVLDPVAAKVGIKGDNAEMQKVTILAVAALVIPAVDPILNYLDVRFRSPPATPPG